MKEGVKQMKYTYLGTQVEIAEQDGRFRAGDDQDDEDHEEKTEHVEELV
jgi:hypothetical protein